MAALNFPNNPSLNQIYTANDTSWRWNGSSWVRVNLGTQGVQGIQGIQGTQGVQGTAADTLWRQGPLGISTSENVGIATTAATAFALDVYGNARVSGILTVGSSSVIINGVNNTVNVGTSATIGTTNTFLKTSLEVTGVSTFQNSVFINGSLIAGAGGGGVSIGDDLTTRNLYASGVSTFIGAITANSATFSGNVTIGGTLKYEDVVNVDSVGIATARSGLRITGGGLDVVGVSTFANAIDANGDLDVDGHTELDDLNVSGITTLNQLNVSGIATIHTLGVSNNFDVYDSTATFHNNVRIEGNLSIGGTTTVIQTQDLKVFDKEITLGITTNIFNQDVSTDDTANHGGIAIASTEGSPLVDLSLVGYSTIPTTYKQLMWVAADSYGVGTTDAWMFNYAVGVGSTLVPNGVYLAAGSVQVTKDTLTAPNINSTNLNVAGLSTLGIATASQLSISGVSTFAGAIDLNSDIDVDGHTELDNLNVSGVSTFVGIGTFENALYVGGTLYAPSLNITGGASLGDDLTTRNLNASGIATVAGATDLNGDLDVDGHTELDNVNISGIVTAFNIDVDGHTELDNIRVSGVATFQSDILLGDGDSAYFGDGADLRIFHSGSHSFIQEQGDGNLYIQSNGGSINIRTSATMSENALVANEDGSVELYHDAAKKFETTGYGATIFGTLQSPQLNVTGISTFAGAIDANGDLDVDGHTELDNVNISGVSTFASAIDANGDLDVDGHTELDNVNISGVLTATSANFSGNVSVLGNLTYEDVINVDSVGIATARAGLRITGGGLDVVGVATFANAIDANGDIDVDGHTELDNVNVSGVLTATSFVGNGTLIEDTVGIQSSGFSIGTSRYLNFVGTGNTFAVVGNRIDISISGNTGAGGTWNTYNAGIATTKSVGIHTSNLDNPALTGVGNSFQGLYISNGMIIHDNVLTGNHYIGTAYNGLMAGPVNVEGSLTIDGVWVVV